MKQWHDLFHSRRNCNEATSAVYIPAGLIMITKGLMTKHQWHGMGQNGGWFRTVL
jgi:hypothetical protein